MRLLIFFFLLALATAFLAAASAKALTDVDCVAIVDSDGTRVARVLSGSQGFTFYMGHNGFAVPFNFSNNVIRTLEYDLYFTDANCSSTPFVSTGNGLPSPTSVLIGQEVYYSEPGAASQSIQALSARSESDGSCQPANRSVDAAPVIGQFTLPQYTLPFLMEPEVCFTPPPAVAALTPYSLAALALVAGFAAFLMMRRGVRDVLTRRDI